jgi:MOSC domain-containing protein YiiM
MFELKQLQNQFPYPGTVEWIGLRPRRDAPMVAPAQASACIGKGLEGDRFSGVISSKRQITLIQAEHLVVIAALLRRDVIDPTLLRRNIVVSGINLLALKDKLFSVGEAVLEMTGLCHPCSKMEAVLGHGGYNAMRGHGGITAKVVRSGIIKLGDSVFSFNDTASA